MQTIKVTMDILLPGGQMVSREEARNAPKANTDHTAIWVETSKWNKATHKKEQVTECLHVFTRKSIPAHQSINLSVEAYDWMIHKDSTPYYIRQNTWNNMSKKQRLEVHLNDVCKTLGGYSFTYEILPD